MLISVFRVIRVQKPLWSGVYQPLCAGQHGITVMPNTDLERGEMADTTPDIDRALWSVVSQIVKLYDAELIAQEWQAGVTVPGKQHRAGVALAVWYTARWPLNRNDEFHYAGFYTHEEIATAEKFLAVLKQLLYDDKNRATNFGELRDQLDDPALLSPYFFLQRIMPLLNEKGITRHLHEILATLSVWLNQNQIIWFTDDPENSGFVVVYPTDMDVQLKPAERVLTFDWYTVVGVLRLFWPTEFCEYVRRNGEGRQHFLAVLVPYQAVADNLER